MELDGLRVNHAGLDQAAEELLRLVAKIDGRLQQLQGELEPLRTTWTGDAQRAFAVAAARWDGAITEMRDLLSSTSQQVRRSNIEYRAADARGARSFGGCAPWRVVRPRSARSRWARLLLERRGWCA